MWECIVLRGGCRLWRRKKEDLIRLKCPLEVGLNAIDYVDKIVKKYWHEFSLVYAKRNDLKCFNWTCK